MSARIEGYDNFLPSYLQLMNIISYILIPRADTQNSCCPSYSSNWIPPKYKSDILVLPMIQSRQWLQWILMQSTSNCTLYYTYFFDTKS
jgi:hypothetical protein